MLYFMNFFKTDGPKNFNEAFVYYWQRLRVSAIINGWHGTLLYTVGRYYTYPYNNNNNNNANIQTVVQIIRFPLRTDCTRVRRIFTLHKITATRRR